MSNIWTQFKGLLDVNATQVATINSTDGETSIVELLNGDTIKVLGTGSVGVKVYIRGGEIIQAAGTLTQYDLTLY